MKIRNYIVTAISYLYALLFIYAAASKLLDFENFRVQLGQSPLLSAFAGWVAVLVPLAEFVIATMLFIPRLRVMALFASFALMTMFSVYIYLILNYSAFVPCSCGGVLEKMTWDQHLVFNLVFVFLAIIAILLSPLRNSQLNYADL